MHAKDVLMDETVDLNDRIGNLRSGLGSDLANMINEAINQCKAWQKICQPGRSV